jgi:hypothetical protein
MNWDTLTLIIWVSIWPAWLILEIVLLIKRGQSTRPLPKTISMVARDMGWRVNLIPYLWSGMATHWWWLASNPYPPVLEGVLGTFFWVIGLALLIWDISLWRVSRDEYVGLGLVVRNPLTWLIVGAMAGRLLFPQVG